MASFLYFHLAVFSLLLPLCLRADYLGSVCDKFFQIHGGETQANRDHVLADLVSKGSIGGFATSSAGNGAATIYGLAQCRGDVSREDCSACLADAAKQLPATCPNQANARIWFDYCILRYDNEDFIGQSDTSNAIILTNVQNATNPEAFDKKKGALMSKVRAQAASAGSGGLGRGKAVFTPYVTIYGLAQCTRDLAPLPCAQCLSAAQEQFASSCQFSKGCQVHYSSCTLRYEIYPFFFPLDGAAKNAAAKAVAGHYTKTVLHRTTST